MDEHRVLAIHHFAVKATESTLHVSMTTKSDDGGAEGEPVGSKEKSSRSDGTGTEIFLEQFLLVEKMYGRRGWEMRTVRKESKGPGRRQISTGDIRK